MFRSICVLIAAVFASSISSSEISCIEDRMKSLYENGYDVIDSTIVSIDKSCSLQLGKVVKDSSANSIQKRISYDSSSVDLNRFQVFEIIYSTKTRKKKCSKRGYLLEYKRSVDSLFSLDSLAKNASRFGEFRMEKTVEMKSALLYSYPMRKASCSLGLVFTDFPSKENSLTYSLRCGEIDR